MKPENSIEVNNVSKKFKVYMDKGRTLKELTLFSKRRKYEEREVLTGISFEVKKGEAVGLIGHNGCGKSTTLKLLSRIMYPDAGTIDMSGRVSSLIELGAGFHPDMSGKQNIYTNASIFGLTRKEIDFRLEDIIAFSELEEFIDNPVRTYSSGMYMRLAFAVAINVDAEILLIDEILAVGDANFQAKCYDKLKEIKDKGTTIVIVSHALGQIEQICERSIWIDKGKIRAMGLPADIHLRYLEYMEQKRNVSSRNKVMEEVQIENQEDVSQSNETISTNRSGDGRVRISEVKLIADNGEEKYAFETGENMSIQVKYRVFSPIKDVRFSFGITRSDGLHCYGTNTEIDEIDNILIIADGEVCVNISQIGLMPGKYSVDFGIEADKEIAVDIFMSALNFEICSQANDIGVLKVLHFWKI